MLSLLYAVSSFTLGIVYANYWVCLYAALAAMGFGLGLFFSRRDTKKIMNTASFKHILITGASGAIGQALALEYAAPGKELTLHGRNLTTLESLAAQCEQKGATVHIATFDLSDTQNMASWVDEICQRSTPDLCIASAGVIYKINKQKNFEDLEHAQQMWQVNVLGTIALIDALVPHLRQQGKGHIVLLSSLASYFGLPSTPSYCATKAALRVYGDALHNLLKADGIYVSTIMPGSIASHMVDVIGKFYGLVLTPEQGARHIMHAISKRKARYIFPLPLSFGCWGLSVLPGFLALPITRWLNRVL